MPLLFHHIVDFNNHACMAGLVWTCAMIVWEIATRKDESTADVAHQISETKVNANVVVSAAWAVGSLLAVIAKKNSSMKKGASILLMSLVIAVSYVISLSPNLDEDATSVVLRTSQRVGLHISVGLFICGILISIH